MLRECGGWAGLLVKGSDQVGVSGWHARPREGLSLTGGLAFLTLCAEWAQMEDLPISLWGWKISLYNLQLYSWALLGGSRVFVSISSSLHWYASGSVSSLLPMAWENSMLTFPRAAFFMVSEGFPEVSFFWTAWHKMGCRVINTVSCT